MTKDDGDDDYDDDDDDLEVDYAEDDEVGEITPAESASSVSTSTSVVAPKTRRKLHKWG